LGVTSERQELERRELERRLLDDSDDLGAWAVYADWLQAQGDPFGERIMLGLARFDAGMQASPGLFHASEAHDRKLAATLLGEHLLELLEQPAIARMVVLERRFGLVLGVRLERWDSPESRAPLDAEARVLAALFASSALRLLSSLELGNCRHAQACAALIAARPLAGLRRIVLGHPRAAWHQDIHELLASVTELRELELCGSTSSLVPASSGLVHARLERLTLDLDDEEGGLMAMLADAELPALRTLVLRFRSSRSPRSAGLTLEELPGCLRVLAANPSLVGLERLELDGAPLRLELQPAPRRILFAELLDTQLLQRMRQIRLSHSELANDGWLLIDRIDEFERLELLELSDCWMPRSLVQWLERDLPPTARLHFSSADRLHR
jgi:uncharacterized protein (TIGR02996 family)